MAQSAEKHSAPVEKELPIRRRYAAEVTAPHRADLRTAGAQKVANRHRTRQWKATGARGLIRDSNSVQKLDVCSTDGDASPTVETVWRDDLDEDQGLPKPQSLLDSWQGDPFSAMPTDLPEEVVCKELYTGTCILSVGDLESDEKHLCSQNLPPRNDHQLQSLRSIWPAISQAYSRDGDSESGTIIQSPVCGNDV